MVTRVALGPGWCEAICLTEHHQDKVLPRLGIIKIPAVEVTHGKNKFYTLIEEEEILHTYQPQGNEGADARDSRREVYKRISQGLVLGHIFNEILKGDP